MLFSSTLFLFLFLPLVLAGNFVIHPALRNAWLLVASLVFYAFGEPFFVLLMLLSTFVNWGFGLWVARDRAAKLPLLFTVVFNVGLLVAFKYADWIVTATSDALLAFGWRDVALPRISDAWSRGASLYSVFFTQTGGVRLPIGISFFTFHAISYVLDVRRGKVAAQRNPFDLALYISLFPQLVAGPIVRYCDVADQIRQRAITLDGFAIGVRRFVLGLGKKMLVANTVAQVADQIFAIPSDQLPPSTAWLGIVCYTVQIYFDFSGYSDMALGLGRMIGFRFLENFNYPYIARSMTDFWRRWHISLSTWFRDYVYIPLGGNRAGKARTYFNLVLVFALCGMWHGASFSFLVWGLYHGAFLVLERVGLEDWLQRRFAALRHVYVLLAVMVGWVFFRADTLTHAIAYLQSMCFLRRGNVPLHHASFYVDSTVVVALLASTVGSTPIYPYLAARLERTAAIRETVATIATRAVGTVVLAIVFTLCCVTMAAGSYNPFIYFRF